MSKHTMHAAFVFGLIAVCSTGAQAEPSRHHDVAAPLSAQLRVVEVSENRAVLELELQEWVDWTLPLSVSVKLPRGVALERGERDFTVTLSEQGVSKTTLEVTYATPPAEPVRVVVASRSKGFGLTANLSASLAEQPAPAAVVAAEPRGAALTVGRFRLGAPVEMASQGPAHPTPSQESRDAPVRRD